MAALFEERKNEQRPAFFLSRVRTRPRRDIDSLLVVRASEKMVSASFELEQRSGRREASAPMAQGRTAVVILGGRVTMGL
jgi:hypothetical protein